MAASNKDELLAVTDKEFSKLSELLERIDVATATKIRDENTSLKDVIGHRAHWITLFLGWYKDGMAGKAVFFPAKGYKWNQLKEYNQQLRAQQADLSWDDVNHKLQLNHKKLLTFINAHSNADLYGGPMKGANNNWTPGRWAEAAGPSHYRSAGKYVRQCLKADKGQ
ncbi:MAG TPA: DfsB family protein [Gammaproteobacteria bacterium]|jgi:hypothetical protein|nr:DfsB family protein [Gammaproteobacteria bacterium]